MAPIDALRSWMLIFVDHIAAKQILAPALNSVVGGPSRLYEGCHGLVQGAMGALVKRAIQSGDLRGDVEALDLLRTLGASSWWGLIRDGSSARSGWWTF